MSNIADKIATLKVNIDKLQSSFKTDVYVNGNKDVVMSLNSKTRMEMYVNRIVKGVDDIVSTNQATV